MCRILPDTAPASDTESRASHMSGHACHPTHLLVLIQISNFIHTYKENLPFELPVIDVLIRKFSLATTKALVCHPIHYYIFFTQINQIETPSVFLGREREYYCYRYIPFSDYIMSGSGCAEGGVLLGAVRSGCILLSVER